MKKDQGVIAKIFSNQVISQFLKDIETKYMKGEIKSEELYIVLQMI